jgi:hypothetical protein
MGPLAPYSGPFGAPASGAELLHLAPPVALSQLAEFRSVFEAKLARYAYLATWDLTSLLGDLAGHQVNVQSARHEFRQLLLTGIC